MSIIKAHIFNVSFLNIIKIQTSGPITAVKHHCHSFNHSSRQALREYLLKGAGVTVSQLHTDLSRFVKGLFLNIIQWYFLHLVYRLEKVICKVLQYYLLQINFSGSSDSKASAYNAGEPGSICGSERSAEKGNSNPLQYSCLENPMD